jgi:hypothetical protein
VPLPCPLLLLQHLLQAQLCQMHSAATALHQMLQWAESLPGKYIGKRRIYYY